MFCSHQNGAKKETLDNYIKVKFSFIHYVMFDYGKNAVITTTTMEE